MRSSLGGVAEAAGFVGFGAEGLHHHVAAEGLLQDLVELALAVLGAAGGAADAAADAEGGQHDEGQHEEADEGQLRVLADDHEEQGDRHEDLAQEIGQDVRGGQLHLVDVVHDGRHELAGGVGFEELGALFQDLFEDGVAQVGDGREADIVDEVIAEVVAEPLGEEDGDDGEGHQAGHVVDGDGNDLVEVDGAVEEGDGVEVNRLVGGMDIEDLVEDRPDEQGDHAGGGAGGGHQEDGGEQVDPVAAGKGEEAEQLAHAAIRRRVRASITWAGWTAAMPPGAEMIFEAVRQGPQMAGSEAPKMTTTGRPKAAAMWAGPESLPTKRAAAASRFLISAKRRAAEGAELGEGGEVVGGAADEDGVEAGLAQVAGDFQEAIGAPGFFGRGGDGMEDGGGGAGGLGGYEVGAGDLAKGHAQIKHGAGEMFGGMHGALDAQDLLRARDANIVDGLVAEVGEAGAEGGSGEGGHPGAARAAVQIEAEVRAPVAQGEELGREEAGDVGVAFEDGAEAVFDHDGDAQVGAFAFENFERGGGEDAIAQRPEPQKGDPALARQIFQNAFHRPLIFDLRLIHQHDGDVVAHRVDAVALDALQAALVGLQLDGGLADGAHQDLQQLFADRHSESSV